MNLKTCILSLGVVGMLTACGHSSDGDSNPGGGQTNVQSDVQSTALTQDDLKLLADADSNEINSYYVSGEGATTSSGLATAYAKIFGSVTELSTLFSSLDSCSTSANNFTSNLMTVNCPGVVGTVSSTLDFQTFTSKIIVSLDVTGAQAQAKIRHTYQSSIIAMKSSRDVDDELMVNANAFALQGSAQLANSASGINFTASYNVTKNAGTADTITVTSSGLQSGSCGLNSGTMTYATSQLSYTITLSACPTVPPIIIPIIPIMPPIIPIIPAPQL